MSIKLEEICSNLGFPEGPVAMNDGAVLFVDIKEQTLMRLAPDGELTTVAHIPGGPNGVAIGPDGAAYVCNNGGVYSFVPYEHEGVQITVPAPIRPNYKGGSVHRVDLQTGAVTQLFDSYQGQRLIAPDDIVFDRSGGFWFTDTGIEDADSTRYGGLYYATIDGKTLIKAATIPMPNGVGLSPDGKTVYVSDTVFGRLWAMEITGPGQVKPGPLPGMPGNVVQTLPGYQWLDSLKVEQDGQVCVGTIFNGGITVFGLDGTTEHVPIPDLFTTNMCFGGPDMRDLWITASSTGKIYKTRWPRPGLKLAYTA